LAERPLRSSRCVPVGPMDADFHPIDGTGPVPAALLELRDRVNPWPRPRCSQARRPSAGVRSGSEEAAQGLDLVGLEEAELTEPETFRVDRAEADAPKAGHGVADRLQDAVDVPVLALEERDAQPVVLRGGR